MDVTLSIVATTTSTAADLHVVAPDGAPAVQVLDAVRAAVGAGPDEPLCVRRRPIASDGVAADCGLADGVVVQVGNAPQPTPRGLTELVVSSGPDSGRRIELPVGEHLVGRASDSALTINDPAVSRAHLVVSVNPDLTTITEVESANGTTIDGARLASWCPSPMAVGEALQLGDSELRLAAAATPAVGPAVIHRPPRLLAPVAPVEVTFPDPPAPSAPTRVPLLAAVAPLVAGVVLAVVLHQWQFLAFTALSPIMILGQAASDRRSARKTSRRAGREHGEATAIARHRLIEALDDERRRRHADAPDLAAITGAALSRRGILWHRAIGDPDALTVRLGRGDLPSEIHVTAGPGHGPTTVIDVPVCVTLSEVGVLGVCGSPTATTGLIRSLVIQATVLHSPEELRLVVLAPADPAAWTWARWLPHVSARDGEACTAQFGFDDEQVSARIGELTARHTSPTGPRTHTLVVVDGTAATRDSSALAALTELGADRLSFIFRAKCERDLPGTTRAVVTVSATPRARLTLAVRGRRECGDVGPDLMAADVAETTARALAALRAGGGSGAATLPGSMRWEQAAGVDLADPQSAAAALARGWSRGPSTTIVLGAGRDEDVTIDLCRDGPHALIAGTTGSGKSELLLSLVASLVAANRPDQLSLLLIDHKGGAAFGPCAALPHTVGVVTDLDADSTRRALLSLTAEIRRREAAFAAVAATDLDSYLAAVARSATSGAEPLARLVIVVDEFAILAEEQPDFVGGLVGIAQRGRSLGVHLVLATQRPDGVVSADIRANTRLRICLAVARENESRDVIDCPDAVRISRATPGRGYLRVGPGDLREFQAARIGGPRADLMDVAVTIAPAAALGMPPATGSVDVTEAADLQVLIDAAIQASATLGCTPPPPPWLPPLPDRLELSTLAANPDPEITSWGRLDLPALGQQRPLLLDLRTGATTLVAGSARSGRTTAARSIAQSAAARRSPDQLHLWAVDAGAGLSDLADLAHCGAVIPAHDVGRAERLVRHLTHEVARRRDDPDDTQPALMLVIDSWEGLAAAGADHDGGRLIDLLLRLAADGPAAGLHMVITSDRGGLVGRLGGATADKIVLRLADPGDFALVGLATRDVPGHLPPGRGVRAADLALVQVAVPDAASCAAAHRWPQPQLPVRRFDALPDRVALSDLRAGGGGPADHLTLGLRADDLSAVTLTRPDVGSSFVIVGPPGSGRSTALLLLARQLTGRRLAVSCLRRSPLLDQVEAIDLPRDDQEHAATLLDSLCRSDAPPDVLIDDIDLLADGPLWAALEELIRNPAAADQVIACTGSIEAFSAAFRGPIAAARRAKTGLLLCPSSRHDAELFGITVPRRPGTDDPPGRGWLAHRGTAVELQLADPGDQRGAAPELQAQPSTVLELSGLGARRRE